MSEPSLRSNRQRWLERAAVAAIVLACVPVALRKIESRDLPFHLVIGREILETGAIPAVDRFTLLGQGREWLNFQWLAQVALALFERAGGLVGVQIATGLVLVATMLASLALARRAGARGLELPLATLVLLASWSRVDPRPDVFSFLLTSAELLLLEGLVVAGTARRRAALIVALVLVQAAWTNVHGSFVLGMAVSSFYAISSWVFREGRAARGALTAAAVLCVAACTCNPRGFRAYVFLRPYVEAVAVRFGLEVASGAPSIQEWQPTFSPQGREFLAGSFAPYVALLALSLPALAAPRRVLPWRMAAVLVLFAGISATALRNVAPFSFVALATVPAGLEGFRHLLPRRASRHLPAVLPVAGIVAALVFAAVMGTNRYYVGRQLFTETGVGWNPACFPVAACDWLEASGIQGQAFHNHELGGYYLWRFDRERRAFLDGRLDLLAPSEMQRYVRAMEDPRLLEGMLREGDVTHILLRYTALDAARAFPYLEEQRSRWRRVYSDGTAVIYVRSDVTAPGTTATPRAVEHPWDRKASRLFAALEPWLHHAPVALYYEARLRELSGEWPAARSLYERALAVDPSSRHLHEGLRNACAALDDAACVDREVLWLERNLGSGGR